MHHDVRSPMITDINDEFPSIYVNPRHTRHHRCELSWESLGNWLLNTPVPTCPYHSCCAPKVEIEFCPHFRQLVTDDFEDYFVEGEFEPEECEYFQLDHRHERLEYLGVPNATEIVGELPATWHENFKYICGDWEEGFGRDRKHLPEWERRTFLACERLYVLESDANKHFSTYFDLSCFWPEGHPFRKTAKENVERAQAKIIEQKRQIYALTAWAQHLPPYPERDFTPTWWLGMRTAMRSLISPV